MNIQENIPLAPFTSFKVGGPARFFCELQDAAELPDILKFSQERKLPLFVLGKGTNMVVSDEGYPGLVLLIGKQFSKMSIQNSKVTVQAGMLLHTLVRDCVEQGLGGMEKMAGIPGTLGGAIRMNAGAFGQEICDSVIQVTSMSPDGTIRTRSGKECEFSYRHSIFCDIDEIILEATLDLSPTPQAELEETKHDIMMKRKSKQPLEYPNAGSMFKRPPGNYAGALIEASGLKGLRIGGASISEKHANFLINDQKGCAQDIFDLSQKVISIVEKEHQITLEREPIFLGNFKQWPR